MCILNGSRKMLAEERFGKILELVNKKGAVTVAELCKAMQVSEATVRRDLGALACLLYTSIF